MASPRSSNALPSYYLTTPIYYVNDQPHIGHVYTTTVADVIARCQRMLGRDVFLLTGTDEHAAKVVDAASERGLGPQEWADRNAAAFQRAFARVGLSHDDFIRTTEERHKERVLRYVRQLLDSGDVYLGEYEGWYDAGQEEYVPEAKAKDLDFRSPINGKPLVRKKEHNYFFRLSHYAEELRRLLEVGEEFDVRPAARKNEVLARIREGLNDVPISRTGAGDWGIRMPGDAEHTIYVWIDALFNYLTAVDTPERRHYWPPQVHLLAKDILWFHAVVWPALLLALSRQPGNEWIRLPRLVYSHSFWIREGQKMSKSLGNFIDLAALDGYIETFGLDGLRYFLVRHGPMGTTDADFVEAKLLEVYNSDLANTLGNCLNRITAMTGRYFDGRLPAPGPKVDAGPGYGHIAEECTARALEAYQRLDIGAAAAAGLELVSAIDGYIHRTEPFKRARNPELLGEVGTILYNAAEAMRIASLLLWPVLPGKIEELWRRLGCETYTQTLADRGRGDLEAWCRWGGLQPGTLVTGGEPLFPRREAPAVPPSAQPTTQGGKVTEPTVPSAAPAAAPRPSRPDPDAVETLPEIPIEQFFQTLLRAGTIVAAQPVPKSKKLMQLTVDIGSETRSIVAGIAEVYSPDELVGRQVVVVANLKPAKLMGVESQGMVLAASADGKPYLVQPSVPVPNGSRVR